MAETQEKPVRRALGRGLDSLLPGAPATSPATPAPRAEDPAAAARMLPVAEIDANPFQTRHHVEPAALQELQDSIALHGVLQPVLVRPIANGRYQLIAGERRWLASRAAGKTHIPAVVKPATDGQALEFTIIENLQRENLDPIEQARAFGRLHEEFQLSHEDIAKRTGKDRSSITNALRLLRLPSAVQESVAAGALSVGHAKVLLALDAEALTLVAQRVIAEGLSVRRTEELVNKLLHPQEKQEKPGVPTDPNVREAENQLRDLLQMKVTVLDRKGKGRVVIEYANLGDFDRLLSILQPASSARQ